jgi:transposase
MSTTAKLTEELWARIEPLLPPLKGSMGRPFATGTEVEFGAVVAHRGRRGTTRIRAVAGTNRTITPSGGPAAD